MSDGMPAFIRSALEVYGWFCRPVCREFGVQQGELNILLFLAGDPERNTAADIHRCSGMKQSMVSLHVESLVRRGYLERQSVPGDRRKVKLVCTPRAEPVVAAGRAAQARYREQVTAGLSREELDTWERIGAAMARNIARCRAGLEKGELEQV